MGRLGADAEDRYDSRFEEDVCQGLRGHSLKVYTQVPCAGYRIDLVVMDEDGRRLAVECDGDFHYEEGDLRPDDYHRQDIIERAGWGVHRVSFRRFYANPQAALLRVIKALHEQPTESDNLVCDVEQRPPAASYTPTIRREETGGENALGSAEKPEIIAGPRLTDHAQLTLDGFRASALPISPDSVRKGITGDDGQPLEGVMAESRNWYAMSHWGKETGLLEPFDRGFAFNIGGYLRRGWSLSSKQARYARLLWRQGEEQGFQPPQDKG